MNCLCRATMTVYILLLTPRGKKTNHEEITHVTKNKKQSNQLLLPHRGDTDTRQDPLSTTIRQ